MPLQNPMLAELGPYNRRPMARGPNLDTFISAADRALRALLAPPAAGRPLPGRPGTARAQRRPEGRRRSSADDERGIRRPDAREPCRRGAPRRRCTTPRRCSPVTRKSANSCSMRRARRPITSPGARPGSWSWAPVRACSIRCGTPARSASALSPRCSAITASLGFVAETERQVEGHLKSHLDRLPARRPAQPGHRRGHVPRRSRAWPTGAKCRRG